MMKIYTQLAEVEMKHGIEPLLLPGFRVSRVIYEWARSKSFASIMKLTEIQEGIIVRCIQRLNITLIDVRNASNIIGDPVLKEKVEETMRKIKRDIVFTPSLYTHN